MATARDGFLIGRLAALIPSVARALCTRAGLDHSVLSDPLFAFDWVHYCNAAGRGFPSPEAALFHYLTVGSRQGLCPRPDFDPGWYLRSNPDVERAGYEPFAHFLQFGRYEGRAGTKADDHAYDLAIPEPDVARMLKRRGRRDQQAKVDIVIPVYGSRLLVLQTIESVLASTALTPFELTVIDDASPDETLRHELQLLADNGVLSLVRNERNIGFVGAANRGLALHADRDVVLLNSDTRVFGDWLDRLMARLYGGRRVATVSPMSNAATILSYPVFLRENHMPSGDCEVLDRLCASINHEPVQIPTAVGFCMAIKRECLKEIGAFDEGRFGRGYGEENDFSLRAKAAGWSHVAATNTFVWHRGGGSFGSERGPLIEAAQQTLESLHPGYAASVQQFIAADALRDLRVTLDASRVGSDPRTKVLIVGDLSESLVGSDALSLTLVPDISPFLGAYRIVSPQIGMLPNLPRIERGRPTSIAEILRKTEIGAVQISPQSKINKALLSTIKKAARIAKVPLIY